MNIKKIKYIVLLLAASFLAGCEEENIPDSTFSSVMIEIKNFKTGKGEYKPGETVSCSFNLYNNSDADLVIKDLSININDLSLAKKPDIYHASILSGINIPAKETRSFTVASAFNIPGNLVPGTSCGIEFTFTFDDGIKRTLNTSFVRITDDKTLTTYKIDKEQYKGLDIFLLSGGMSAEFAVQKSLASFASGISHTWKQGNGGGPEPVLVTPDFLPRSINKTVEMYNEVLGATAPVKTVIIGTGVPSVSYLSSAMKAPYLPIHFLGSANTVQEIQSVLDYANNNGYPSYATLGYDGSMKDVGVAWVKLLDLPEEYKKFLNDHQVQEVILLGVGEKVIGESYARKLITEPRTYEYGEGSLYIQYTQYGSASDVEALSSRIYDFKSLQLDNNRLIADWESGILDRQIGNFSKSIKAGTTAQPYSLSCSADMISLYNLASTLTAFNIKQNESTSNGMPVKGVILNEYLGCSPQYELLTGFTPLLYWQFVSTGATIDRVFSVVKTAITTHYPSVDFNSLKFYLNSGYGNTELRDGLVANGIPFASVTLRGAQVVWDPSDGMQAPCELAAEDIVNNIGAGNYKTRIQSLLSVSVEDLETICSETPGVILKKE